MGELIQLIEKCDLGTLRRINLRYCTKVDEFLTGLSRNNTWISLSYINLDGSSCEPHTLKLLLEKSSFIQPLVRNTIIYYQDPVTIIIEGYTRPKQDLIAPSKVNHETIYHCYGAFILNRWVVTFKITVCRITHIIYFYLKYIIEINAI